MKELWAAEYAAGATLREIADLHGVDPATVRRYLLAVRVPLRARGVRPVTEDRAVQALADEGLGSVRIAAALGVSSTAASNALRRIGITQPPRRDLTVAETRKLRKIDQALPTYHGRRHVASQEARPFLTMVRALLSDGVRSASIAAALEVSTTTVFDWAARTS